jgi:hypothetical protein
MLTAEAQIDTERPSRYLVQFCKHAAAMGGAGGHGPRVHLGGMLARREVQVHAEWSDTEGTVTFTSWGQCTMQARANTLTVRIEATDVENLRQIQEIVTGDFNRFSRRDPLTVNWRQPEPPPVASGQEAPHSAPTPAGQPALRRWPLNRRTIVLVVAAALAVAVHLGLGGAVLAGLPWTTGVADIVLAIVALKIVLIAFGIRHHRATQIYGRPVTGGDAPAEH